MAALRLNLEWVKDVVKGGEQCIPWDPIAKEANRYMELNVIAFEQELQRDGRPVTMTLEHSRYVAAEREWRFSAWRMTFHGVPGFRFRPIAQRPEVSAVTRPTPGQQLEVALWEIVRSRWLPEAAGALHARPAAFHHFVVASSYDIYDIAAEYWEVEQIVSGQTSQQPSG